MVDRAVPEGTTVVAQLKKTLRWGSEDEEAALAAETGASLLFFAAGMDDLGAVVELL